MEIFGRTYPDPTPEQRARFQEYMRKLATEVNEQERRFQQWRQTRDDAAANARALARRALEQ